MAVKCFMVEWIGQSRRYLRRYTAGEFKCAGAFGYHNAAVSIRKVRSRRDANGYYQQPRQRYETDKRWPVKCDYCDYRFKRTDARQVNDRPIYVRRDTGDEYTLNDLPPGAMYDAWWIPYKGSDGKCLIVICPNGVPWTIDGPANNCTMPDDLSQRRHHCWIRHGDPPNITVDKNGVTCNAGGGSIQAGNYHGFLQHGSFT